MASGGIAMTQERIWSRVRASRRAALRGAALSGGGLAAISLIGCGGDDSGSSSKTTTSEKLDSTKGKPGGTLATYAQDYPSNFSPVFTSNSWWQIGWAHSGLLQHTWGVAGADPYDFYTYEPEVARALPEQPDESTLIFK